MVKKAQTFTSPCYIGQKCWTFIKRNDGHGKRYFLDECTVSSIIFSISGDKIEIDNGNIRMDFWVSHIGLTVFLDEIQAKERLKIINGGNNDETDNG